MKHVFTLMGVCLAMGTFAQSALAPASLLKAENPTLLSEINQPETGDSYPYLSADGLRLYFIQGKSIADNQLFTASRTSTDKPFSNAQTLSSVIPWAVLSVWLNANETELYFVQDKQLYFCTRASRGADFSFPVPVTLLGIETGFISAPSFTPDKQELYLYHNQLPVEKGVYRFKKTGEAEYTFVSDFAPPTENRVGPGQLSKNGLSYYFEVEGSPEKIYKMTRKSLTSEWENLNEIAGLGNAETNCIQPSVSADERTIAYVSNTGNSWGGNELTLAQLPQTSKPDPTLTQVGSAVSALSVMDAPVSSVQFSAYPNPTDSKLVLAWDEVKTGGYFTLLDIHGRELLRQSVYETQTTVDLSPYPSGIYFVAWSQNNAGGSVKVVKQ